MPRAARRLRTALLAAGLAAASPLVARVVEAPPLGRLPDDVRPSGYALALEIDPGRERFAGEVALSLELDRVRDLVWLNGRGLMVGEVYVEANGERVHAKWRQVDPLGVVAVYLRRAIGPGTAVLHVRWEVPYGRQLQSVYRVRAGDRDYVFTQFEPTLARQAFPSFDEPARKAPFDLTLVVPAGLVAVANTPIADRTEAADGRTRLRFARTLPLPPYLIAFAVGPLDVVPAPDIVQPEAPRPPLPFRGVAAAGRGDRLAFALRGTPPLLLALETYFAIPFPFPKLDLIAVPDLAWGGMENAGAITLRESLALIDPERASESQRRGFASVTAHELAHQWFGDYVTMRWWDDLWLNEGFATWMAARVLEQVHPPYQSRVVLLEEVQSAMRADGFASARRVREPIRSHHDVSNAFDAITYSKGAGLLEMFEHWIGRDRFREGLRRYLIAYREASATADELLNALSGAAGRDVGAPFRSFLDQPGVPAVSARLACGPGGAELSLAQERYLPLGSSAERAGRWQIPACVRLGLAAGPRESCTLVAAASETVALGPECPRWLLPNAQGAGYYRWTLPAPDVQRLVGSGWKALGVRERLSLADNLAAAVEAGTLPAADWLGALPPFAGDPSRAVATAPLRLLALTHDQLAAEPSRPAVARYVRRLYGPTLARLGLAPRARDDGQTKLLRARVVAALADTGDDPAVRRPIAERGRAFLGIGTDGKLHPDAVAPELVDTALAIALETGEAPVFDAALRHLEASDDEHLRGQLLGAIGQARAPELAARARELVLDERLHVNERTIVLRQQMEERALRPAAWDWVTAHFTTLVARLSERDAARLPWLAASFCDDADAARVETFLAPFVDDLPGGPRNLRGAVERIRTCAAIVRAQRASVEAFLRDRG